MALQVILNEDVQHLGHVGEIVTVADGYARNYLLPRKLALIASQRNVRQLEHTRRLVDVKAVQQIRTAQDLAKKLNEVSVTIARTVGEEDKLFGSVTNRDIAEAIAKEGHEIDRRAVILNQPIKSLGVYSVEIKLRGDVKAAVKVWVVAE
jgi:large subunit ribosomal protein L9